MIYVMNIIPEKGTLKKNMSTYICSYFHSNDAKCKFIESISTTNLCCLVVKCFKFGYFHMSNRWNSILNLFSSGAIVSSFGILRIEATLPNRTSILNLSVDAKTGFDEYRSSHRRYSKKGVLKNISKLTGKHLCQNLFFNKLAC